MLELIDKVAEPAPMIFRDPQEHTRLRKLVSRAFSPRQISRLEPEIRRIAASYLDQLVGEKRFDFLEDFGNKLPVMVISTLLGVPEEDREDIRHWTDALLHRDEGDGAESRAERGGRGCGGRGVRC